MTTKKQGQKEKWEIEFDFEWGEAPPESLSYVKRQKMKHIIEKYLRQAREEGGRGGD